MSTWIGSSFISVFLLFMGGILIGHLMWYRDRSSDLQAIKDAETKYSRAKAAARARKRRFVLLSRDARSGEQASTKYRVEADSLRETLATETQRADSLQREMGKLQAEQRRFEFACRDAEKQRDAAREQVDITATELISLRDRLQDTESKLNAASTAAEKHADSAESVSSELTEKRARCVELATSHDALLAETRELRRKLESAQSHREQLSDEQTKLQREYDQLELERDQLAQLHGDGARDLDGISQRGEQLAAEIDQLHIRYEELIVNRDLAVRERDQVIEHRDQLVIDLESFTIQHDMQVAEHDRVVNEHVLLVRERDALAEERDQLADRLTTESTAARHTDEEFIELQKEYDSLRDQHAAAISANRDQASLYESRQSEFARLEIALHESSIQVQTLQSEHDELLDQLDERTSRIQTAIDGRVTAETALSEMEARIESLLNELADANETRSHHEMKLAEVQSSGSELQSQAAKLHEAIRDRDQRIVEMEKQVAEQNIAINRHCAEAERLRSGGPKLKQLEETIAAKSAQLVEANSNLQSSRDLAASLRSEIGLRDGQVASLDQAQQQIRVQLADQTALIARLEHELRGATARVEMAKQHEPRAAEFQQQAAAMHDKAAAMQSHSESLQKQLDSVAADLESSLDANAAMQQRVRQIEGQLHENAIAMRDLRRKRANVPALGASPAREQNKAA